MRKKIIFALLIAIICAIIFCIFFIRTEEAEFVSIEVSRGEIVEDILATGQIKMGEELNLNFKTPGKIQKVYVEIGDKVKTGQLLAELETTQLDIQRQEAISALAAAQANFNKLLAGARIEEITAAQLEYESSKINLTLAQNNLTNSYQKALPVLDSARLSVFNTQKLILALRRKISFATDHDSMLITTKIEKEAAKIETALNQMINYIEKARADLNNADIEKALVETIKNLNLVADSLIAIREAAEDSPHRGLATIELADLSNQQAINANALNNVISSEQALPLMKLNVDLAQNQVRAAKIKLDILQAGPRQEDINFHQAQINQAQARISLLENQIKDSKLFSPINGQVIKINKSPGELIQPAFQDTIITILPKSPFEIETTIYEEDIIKIETGDIVDIHLVALPEKTFRGKVANIDPSEKLKDGVVHYRIIIVFEEEVPEIIKPGMTADVRIITKIQENVLRLPEHALQREKDKILVEVFRDGLIEKREIQIGIQGNDNMVEAISGLSEGEKVILR